MKSYLGKSFDRADMVAEDLLFAAQLVLRMKGRLDEIVKHDKVLHREIWEAFYWLEVAANRAEIRMHKDDGLSTQD